MGERDRLQSVPSELLVKIFEKAVAGAEAGKLSILSGYWGVPGMAVDAPGYHQEGDHPTGNRRPESLYKTVCGRH